MQFHCCWCSASTSMLYSTNSYTINIHNLVAMIILNITQVFFALSYAYLESLRFWWLKIVFPLLSVWHFSLNPFANSLCSCVCILWNTAFDTIYRLNAKLRYNWQTFIGIGSQTRTKGGIDMIWNDTVVTLLWLYDNNSIPFDSNQTPRNNIFTIQNTPQVVTNQ